MIAPRKHVVLNLGILAIVFLTLIAAMVLSPAIEVKTSAQGKPVEERETLTYRYLATAQVETLNKLWLRMEAGEPFSNEEKSILKRFVSDRHFPEIDAQVVASRALFDRFVLGKSLTIEQQDLLDRYIVSAAHRPNGIADLKLQLASQVRKSATRANTSPTAPLVASANDTCAGAEVIPAAGPFPYLTAVTADITDNTTTGDPPAPSCSVGPFSRSIWYKFTPSATATYQISSCADSPTGTTVDDTVMAIYTSSSACGGTFTQIPTGSGSVGCDDDSCGAEDFQAVVTTSLTAGTTYYVLVWQFDTPPPTAGNTAVQLRVSQLATYANDTCAGAVPLSLDTPVAGSTLFASMVANDDYHLSSTTCFTGLGDNSIGNSTSTAAGRDVVYSFTASATTTYSFRISGLLGSSDPLLFVSTSCPAAGGSPVTITCSSASGPAVAAAYRANSTGVQEVPCLALSSGQTVYIFVDEDSLSSGRDFTIEVNRCTQETEPNGTPATATIGTEGVLNASGDVDFYTLGIPASGARVFALVDGVAANSEDFDLRVTTTTDTLEYDAQNAASQFGELSSAVGGVRLTGVESFLRISRGALASASTGPYRLYTQVQPSGTSLKPNCSGTKDTSATDEVEPNGSTAQASSAANNYFTGTVSTTSDTDFFSFSATAGDLIFLAVDGDPCRGGSPAAMNAALELEDAGGLPLLSVNDPDGTTCTTCTPAVGTLTGIQPASPAEALVFRARYTGTYYAKISSGVATSVGTGDYLLSVSLNNDHGPTAADSSIAGRVSGTGGEPLAGVSMVLTSGAGTRQTTTDADGLYSFADLETGDFFVVAPAGNYTFTPSRRPFSLRGNVRNANFTANAAWADRTKSRDDSPAAGSSDLKNNGSSNGQSVERSWATALPSSARDGALRITPESLEIQQGIAAGPAVKIQVSESGWYRLTQAQLVSAGLDPAANARMLQLYVDGEEIPMLVSGDGANLKPTDTVEFYGLGLDTPTTDLRTYWLVNGSAPGQRISGRRNKAGSYYVPWPQSPSLASFSNTTERQEKLTYFGNLLNGDAENIFGQLVMQGEATIETLSAKSLDSDASFQPELEIALQGVTSRSHQVQVKLNGTDVGAITFDDRKHSVTKLLFDRGLLCNGDNQISLAAIGGNADISFVDWVRLTYARKYVADNNTLQFSVPAGRTIRVTGFTTPNIRLVDITDPKAVTEVDTKLGAEGAGYSLNVWAKGSQTRTFLAFAENQAKSPATIAANSPSTWNAEVNAADMVIITHKDFRGAIEPLAALRSTQGLRVAIIDIEDVYDEFSYGIHTPIGLKNFLAWTASHWNSVPQFVLLVGDSSWDPRDYLGQGNNDFVPTKLIDTRYLETASDDWLVDFNGTGRPNMAIGRLPARTVGEVNLMVSKILAYEQERQTGAPLRGAVMVADGGFERESSQTRALLPAGLSVQTINRSTIGNDDLTRQEIIGALGQGPMLVNYFGHGSLTVWTGAGLLENDSAHGLTNTDRLSLFVMMTCLNGYAHDAYIDSLSEAALKAPEGGAMAVWASSGMTEPGPQFGMSSEFYRQIFGTQSLRLGQAIQNAKAVTLDIDVRRTWLLLGDPAMRLR